MYRFFILCNKIRRNSQEKNDEKDRVFFSLFYYLLFFIKCNCVAYKKCYTIRMKRPTPLKEAIVTLLEKNHLLSAPQLVDHLHAQAMMVNKTSVYRTLTQFMKDDVVCQQSLGGDEFVYELQKKHHDHVRCKVCGRVEEMPCIVSAPQTVKGFTIDHHHLTLYGMCHECENK